MASEPRPLISDSLLHQLQETARAQNREPAEVLEEAWTRYVEQQSWAKLMSDGRKNSRRLGFEEADTERLIAEYRQAKRGR